MNTHPAPPIGHRSRAELHLAEFNARRTERQPTASAPTPSAPTATPAVRATARTLGVDLATVKGTGAGGRITPKDVRAAAPAPQPVAQDDSYPAWMNSVPTPAATTAEPAPRAGKHAGTAYPADWAL